MDDIRSVPMVYPQLTDADFVIVRDMAAFKNVIETRGLPDCISFDNDLGLDADGQVAPDGYAAAKWLVYESDPDLTSLRYHVHSANPVACWIII